MLADVRADCVLHFGRFRALVRGPSHVRVELGIGQLNRRNLGVDAQRNHMVVDQLAHLGADILAQYRRVLVAVAGAGVDISEFLGVLGVRQAFRSRQHCVERSEEGLELDGKLGAQLLATQHLDAGFGVLQRLDAPLAEQIHHAQMPVSQHRHLVFQAGQRAFHVLISVGRQRLLQMLRDTEVVHHDAATFAETGAVDAGNRLQQLRLADRAVEVHHTLNRRIKAGQQHRLHHQEGQRVGLLGLGMEQRFLEAFDQLLVRRAVCPLLPDRVVVVAARNDGCEFNARQRVAIAPGLHHRLHAHRTLTQGLVIQRLVLGRERVGLGQQLSAG